MANSLGNLESSELNTQRKGNQFKKVFDCLFTYEPCPLLSSMNITEFRIIFYF